MVKSTNSIDKHIGMRVRRTRLFREMSQEAFAVALGVSLHQVKKYESGFERIGASQLAEICRIFRVRPSFFFANLKVGGPAAKTGARRPDGAQNVVALETSGKSALDGHAELGHSELSARLAALAEQDSMRNSPIFGMLHKLEAELRAQRTAREKSAPGQAGSGAKSI